MPEPTHVYMDLDVINSDFQTATAPQLRFEEVRNTPFLEGDSSDYFCSVVRFSIQTGNTLPVLIPRIQTGQYNRNLTEYSITLRDWVLSDTDTPDVVATTYMYFQTQDLTAPEPASPLVAQDLSSSYYYIYTYQHFIKLVNTASADATGELIRQYKILVPSPASPSLTDYYMQYFVGPHLDYDTSSNRIVLHVDEGTVEGTTRHWRFISTKRCTTCSRGYLQYT